MAGQRIKHWAGTRVTEAQAAEAVAGQHFALAEMVGLAVAAADLSLSVAVVEAASGAVLVDSLPIMAAVVVGFSVEHQQ